MTYRLHYAPDNASLIIRMVLLEMKVPFDVTLVDRRQNAQNSPNYRMLNPNGLIPVLETPSGPIFETGAILLWLSETHGQMAPQSGSPERANFLKWLFFNSNTLHAGLRMLFYPEKYAGPAATDPLRNQMQSALRDHLKTLDGLAAQKPEWFGGEHPSVLDVYICACLRWMAIYPKGQTMWFTLTDYPALADLAARLQTRPSALITAQAEGLGLTIFTNPTYCSPPEGSPT
ncbi:glutathione S-transferase family protein [Aestuariibius sp. HNIBRBA575]|uniref:glutathione S-transferase family protein n=1 Tax=Aestuariibius sp. HNIBRBA575 TaxID=3233343 RepID=UPI0034A54D19